MPLSNKPVIVIYGGTFNPIHNGHLFPAIESAKSVNAETLIYLPCHIPPHKETPNVSSFHRLQMTKLALQNLDDNQNDSSLNIETSGLNIEISDYEIQLTTPSYTRQTIEYFYHKYPDHKLYFLIGMDSLINFHLWFKWQEIFSFCDLLVMQRPGVEYNPNKLPSELQPYLKSQVIITSVTEVDTSSSEIQNMYSQSANKAENRNKNELTMLPPAVQQYIDSHNLYK
ncbi:nicotinate (nicotinamide) nucleotide adenylyltransferase [uncultured Psychrosphaera sp.]|uniref:nicotinate (nicotinamide) nucleotide adenylyltransferase n=1 Tax=uncultured Psychrosphaera sp. TaxID=1403522 RepID=UPI00262CD2F0|nr:nicotinate (nicotinamide) nucleotide adenylyltransferase [uncultured Psychrosphaera sp.]